MAWGNFQSGLFVLCLMPHSRLLNGLTLVDTSLDWLIWTMRALLFGNQGINWLQMLLHTGDLDNQMVDTKKIVFLWAMVRCGISSAAEYLDSFARKGYQVALCLTMQSINLNTSLILVDSTTEVSMTDESWSSSNAIREFWCSNGWGNLNWINFVLYAQCRFLQLNKALCQHFLSVSWFW